MSTQPGDPGALGCGARGLRPGQLSGARGRGSASQAHPWSDWALDPGVRSPHTHSHTRARQVPPGAPPAPAHLLGSCLSRPGLREEAPSFWAPTCPALPTEPPSQASLPSRNQKQLSWALGLRAHTHSGPGGPQARQGLWPPDRAFLWPESPSATCDSSRGCRAPPLGSVWECGSPPFRGSGARPTPSSEDTSHPPPPATKLTPSALGRGCRRAPQTPDGQDPGLSLGRRPDPLLTGKLGHVSPAREDSCGEKSTRLHTPPCPAHRLGTRGHTMQAPAAGPLGSHGFWLSVSEAHRKMGQVGKALLTRGKNRSFSEYFPGAQPEHPARGARPRPLTGPEPGTPWEGEVE